MSTAASVGNEIASASPVKGATEAMKIGIGLGVPIGLIALTTVGYIIYRHSLYKRRRRERQAAAIIAQAPYQVDEAGRRDGMTWGATEVMEDEKGASSVLSPVTPDSKVALHGLYVPQQCCELEGSPGSAKGELQ